MRNRREIFFKHIAQTSDAPLAIEIDRSEGAVLYSGDKEYLDCISGIAVNNIGHSHPKIKEAILAQLNKHTHLMVYGELIQDAQTDLTEALCKLLPETLNTVYYVNSGSEAVEGAMKLAKRYTGRHRFVAIRDAYHGSTQGALSLMSNAYFSNAFTPLLPGVTFLEQNDAASIETLLDESIAAVFVEPVMGEKGYIPCEPEFLKKLRDVCSRKGILLVFDEIQTAIGRTGKHFAFEYFQVVPDVLLLAKSFGGGLPLGAFVSSAEIMKVFRDEPVLGHITTFGGHPLSCAAALASLKVIEEEALPAGVKEKELLFRDLLKHKAIEKIDGCGLMLSVCMNNATECRRVIDNCVKDGLLIDWFLYAENRIRLAPPLNISESQIRRICGIIIENIEKVTQP